MYISQSNTRRRWRDDPVRFWHTDRNGRIGNPSPQSILGAEYHGLTRPGCRRDGAVGRRRGAGFAPCGGDARSPACPRLAPGGRRARANPASHRDERRRFWLPGEALSRQEVWRILLGESPGRERVNHPPVSSVAPAAESGAVSPGEQGRRSVHRESCRP